MARQECLERFETCKSDHEIANINLPSPGVYVLYFLTTFLLFLCSIFCKVCLLIKVTKTKLSQSLLSVFFEDDNKLCCQIFCLPIKSIAQKFISTCAYDDLKCKSGTRTNRLNFGCDLYHCVNPKVFLFPCLKFELVFLRVSNKLISLT